MALFNMMRGEAYAKRMSEIDRKLSELAEGIARESTEERFKLLTEFALAFMHATGVTDPREIVLVETRLHDSITWHYEKRGELLHEPQPSRDRREQVTPVGEAGAAAVPQVVDHE